MSDSRLRELERRWQETGAPDDWGALLRAQARAGTGAARDAVAFLEEALAFAQRLKPEWRSLLTAYVAWGYADLGEGERALDLAREADPGQPESLVDAAALARLAAVRERLSGDGVPLLEGALVSARTCLGGEEGPRFFTVMFLAAIEDAFPAAAFDRGLLSAFLEAVPPRQLIGFGQAVVDLDRLGAGPAVLRLRALLDPRHRWLHGVEVEREGWFLSEVLDTLLFLGHAEDAERLFSAIRLHGGVVGMGETAPLQRAFGACDDPRHVVEQLQPALGRRDPYEGLAVELALLGWAATQDPPPDWARARLAALLADAKRFEGPGGDAPVRRRVIPLAIRLGEPPAQVVRLLEGELPLPVALRLRASLALAAVDSAPDVARRQLALLGKQLESVDLTAVLGAFDLLQALWESAVPAARALQEPRLLDVADAFTERALEAHPHEDLLWFVAKTRLHVAATRIDQGQEVEQALQALEPVRAQLEPGLRGLCGTTLAALAREGRPAARPALASRALALIAEAGLHEELGPRDAVEALGGLCRDLVGARG